MTTPPNYDYSVSVDAEGVFTIVPEDGAPESPLPLMCRIQLKLILLPQIPRLPWCF